MKAVGTAHTKDTYTILLLCIYINIYIRVMSSHGRIQISFVQRLCVPNSVTQLHVKITTYLQTTQLYCTVIQSLHSCT